MTKRGGNGRRLTYRERWECLREWVADPDGLMLYAKTRWYASRQEEAFTSAKIAITVKLDDLDRTTLVKARPVRKGKGRKR